jgi:hypothetical protein
LLRHLRISFAAEGERESDIPLGYLLDSFVSCLCLLAFHRDRVLNLFQLCNRCSALFVYLLLRYRNDVCFYWDVPVCKEIVDHYLCAR